MLKQSWLGALLLRPADMRKLPHEVLPAGRLPVRRIPVVRHRRRGRSQRRREGLRPQPAVALHPDRRHAVDLFAALRHRQRRSLAHPVSEPQNESLSLAQRTILPPASLRKCAARSRYSRPPTPSTSPPPRPVSRCSAGRPVAASPRSESQSPSRTAWSRCFRPKAFAELDTGQAIVLPYDGKKNLSARRCYLKPFYLPRDLSYWRQHEKGMI